MKTIAKYHWFFFSGNVINIQTGEWRGIASGLGAGLDSFYEYLLKSFFLFGVQSDIKMFQVSLLDITFMVDKHFLKVKKKMTMAE